MWSGSGRERKATKPSEPGQFDSVWVGRFKLALSAMPPLVVRLGKACQLRARLLRIFIRSDRLELSILFDVSPDQSPILVSYLARDESVLGECAQCSRGSRLLTDACAHVQGGAFLFLSSLENFRLPEKSEPVAEPQPSFYPYSSSRPSGVFLTRLPPDWGFLIRTGLRQAMSHRSYLDWTNRFRQPTGHRLPEYSFWKTFHEAFFLEEIREWKGERYPLFFPKTNDPSEAIFKMERLPFYRPGETDRVSFKLAEPSWLYEGRWMSFEAVARFQGVWRIGGEVLPAHGSRWLERKHIRVLDVPSALILLPDSPAFPQTLIPFLECDPDADFTQGEWTDKLAMALELVKHSRIFFFWNGQPLEEVFSVQESWEPRIDLLHTDGQGLKIFPSVQSGQIRIPLFGPERNLQPDTHVQTDGSRTEFLKRDRQKELLLRNIVERTLRKSSTTAWIHLSQEEAHVFWKTGWKELEQEGFSRGVVESRSGKLLSGAVACHVFFELLEENAPRRKYLKAASTERVSSLLRPTST